MSTASTHPPSLGSSPPSAWPEPRPPPATRGLFDQVVRAAKGRGGRSLVIALWVIGNMVPGAYLLGNHLLTRTVPTTPEMALALTRTRTDGERGRWLAVHVLYAGCACSRRVAEHLVEEGVRRDVAERVLLVDHDPRLEGRLSARGFRVEVVSGEELKSTYAIEGVPLLVVMSPGGEVRYAGGYTDRKQGGDYRDVEIVDAALGGASPDALPLFGCPANRDLQRRVDPLGLQFGAP